MQSVGFRKIAIQELIAKGEHQQARLKCIGYGFDPGMFPSLSDKNTVGLSTEGIQQGTLSLPTFSSMPSAPAESSNDEENDSSAEDS